MCASPNFIHSGNKHIFVKNINLIRNLPDVVVAYGAGDTFNLCQSKKLLLLQSRVRFPARPVCMSVHSPGGTFMTRPPSDSWHVSILCSQTEGDGFTGLLETAIFSFFLCCFIMFALYSLILIRQVHYI